MKKPISFLCLLLAFCQLSVAQRNDVDDIDRENFFRIGAKAGVNVNKIPGESYKQGFNFNYQLGGFMQFNFSKRFGVQPEVNFVQSTSAYGEEPSDVTNDLFYGGTQKNAKLNYLEIPILMNMNIGESRHVKLQFGPSYGMYLKGVSAYKEVNDVQYNNHELSLVSGLWIQLPFINLGGRYRFSLSKIHDAATGQSGYNQAIEIFSGFTF
jgi:hypothetical protein